VLHAEQGVIYNNTVMQGERVLGVLRGRLGSPSPRHEPVLDADRAVAKLVTRLRRSFGQPTQDPGGYQYLARHPDIVRWPPVDAVHATLDERCRAALDPEDLHFVAVVRHGYLQHCTDVFDKMAMEPFFRAGYTVERRRRFYTEF